MAERGNKFGFDNIRAEAASIAANPNAQEFVNTAKSGIAKAPSSKVSLAESYKGERKLVVDGHLKNRNQSCQPPMQLYLRNELAEWMKRHASAGRGGNQILINYLIKRGIQVVEEEYAENGIILADESQD
jgi:hypothetical protein